MQELYLKKVYQSLKKPIVVKPNSGTYGNGITLNISSYKECVKAVEKAKLFSRNEKTDVVIEEMFQGGEEYRILVTKKKVIGVLKRRPASIVGNNINTVNELIEEKNLEDIRTTVTGNLSHERIIIDKQLKQFLKEQNLTLQYIPEKNERIFLRKVSNISKGGDAIDYTDIIHDSVKEIAIKTINAIPGLSFSGIDFMSKDIRKQQTKDSYIIIETNTSPGLGMHSRPYEGKDRHGATNFLQVMFPELQTAE